jgi:hypothetical protein
MPLIKPIGRRGALSIAGAAALAGKARADNPAEVKIAMMVPLSGPWARSGWDQGAWRREIETGGVRRG